MKVLVIGPFPYPIDGCSNANKVFYQNLKKRAVPSDFINTNTPVISGDQGSTFSFKKAVSFLRNYSNFYKIGASDVVYFTPGQTFYGILKYAPFILLCMALRKPYTIHVHGNHLGVHYRLLQGSKKKIFHFLISHAAAGIVITRSLKENFKGLLPENKVFVVDYFVEDYLYKLNAAAKKDDKLHILYLSNLMKEKGILECLDALAEIKQKNIAFHAVIAGSVETGLQAEIDKRLHQLGSDASYVGVITGEEKIKAFAQANVFILPTYYPMEGLPFSLLEAIAIGNIVITTKHAGIPDVVNEKNGFIVAPHSSAAITECLQKINENIRQNVHDYSAYNMQYAASHFTENNFTNQILDVLMSTRKK